MRTGLLETKVNNTTLKRNTFAIVKIKHGEALQELVRSSKYVM